MNFIDRIKNAAKGLGKADTASSSFESGEQEMTDDALQQSMINERLDRLKTLTPREQEVYSYLVKGLKMREIASLMGVSYSTVNFHCKGLYKKLGINTRAQLFLQYAALNHNMPQK